MQVLAKDIIKLADETEYYRFKVDGIPQDGTSNQYVSTLATFTTRGDGKAVIIDQVFCAVDLKQTSTKIVTLELNVYNKPNPTLGDAQQPDFPQSMPVCFDTQGGSADLGQAFQTIYAWCRWNQTLQVCMRQNVTNQAPPGPYTVQFRKRVLDVRA